MIMMPRNELDMQTIPRTSISVVIPTFGREAVLLETIRTLLELAEPADQILVIDQTPRHDKVTQQCLHGWHEASAVNWIRLPEPSIPHAMNVGLLEARSDIVLFLDDDIVPGDALVSAHRQAHHSVDCAIVAGQVLQPGERTDPPGCTIFSFRATRQQYINEFMGGNFSIKRTKAIEIGGFDERFVKVAYRFEAEFAHRVSASGGRIYFEPTASIRHLHAAKGGTRSFGSHLRTFLPNHTVGAYYFFLRGRLVEKRLSEILLRPLRSVRTRYHLERPWWIPIALIAEFLGFIWAIRLHMLGPKLLEPSGQ